MSRRVVVRLAGAASRREPGPLPLFCRLSGHHWRSAHLTGVYFRVTCPRCAHIDVRLPA